MIRPWEELDFEPYYKALGKNKSNEVLHLFLSDETGKKWVDRLAPKEITIKDYKECPRKEMPENIFKKITVPNLRAMSACTRID